MAVEFPTGDVPLRLGPTMLQQPGGGARQGSYLMFHTDFEPESMQRMQTADLLMPEGQPLKLVPLANPDGDNPAVPFHFEGAAEDLDTSQQQQQGGDVECVAYFDGQQWTLELLATRVHAKYKQGAPMLRGYDLPAEGDAGAEAAAAHASAAAAGAQQQLSHASLQDDAAHEEGEVDPELAAALNAAFDEPTEPVQQQQCSTALTPGGSSGGQPSPEAEPLAAVQQQQQLLPAPVSAASDDDDDDDDDHGGDVWDTFEATAEQQQQQTTAGPTQPAAAAGRAQQQQLHRGPPGHVTQAHMPVRSLTPQPVPAAPAAAAAAPAAPQPPPVLPAAAQAAGVSVLGGHDEDEDEEPAHGMHDCSDDESDGVGVEFF